MASCLALYSSQSARPYEDYVELPLAEVLESDDEREYGLFERFFHKDSFVVITPLARWRERGWG